MSDRTLKRNAATVNRKYTEYFLPTLLTAMANSIAAIVDSIIAGNILGSSSLAAINLLSPIMQLYFSMTILLGLGASTVVSISKGKRDEKGANQVFTTAFVSILILSAILIAIQLPLADTICSLLTSDSELHGLVCAYYVPYIIGTPLNLLLLCSIYFIRADSRPRFASNIIIIANVVNLIMDFVYMGVFKMGISGSSIATLTGYAVGLVVMLTHFLSSKSTLRFDFSILKNLRLFFKLFLHMCSIGIPGAIGTLLVTVKMLFLNTIIQSTGGSDAMVSYSVCSSAQIFVTMFITGASQTMIPIVGVCLGERDYEGVRYAFRRASKILIIASLVITAVVCVTPESIIHLYGVTAENDIINTIPALRINALSFIFYALSCLFMYYYMSIQKRILSTTMSIVSGIVSVVPTAWILGYFFGIIGIWLSLVVSQVITMLVMFIFVAVLKKKSKGKYTDFYLIEKNDENEIISLSIKGTKENAAGVSLYLTSFLTTHNVEKSKANKIAVAVEEIAADLAQRMDKQKKADIDIRILIDKEGMLISIRDNGTAFDTTMAEDDEALSSMKIIKAISTNVEYSRVLGFNRTLITI